MLALAGLLSFGPGSGHPRNFRREEFMITRTSPQTNDVDRLPKNFPALQERMDAVKRSSADKQQSPSRSPLENTPVVDKDDSFFLL